MPLFDVYLSHDIDILVAIFARLHDVLDFFVISELLNFANLILNGLSMCYNSWATYINVFAFRSDEFIFTIRLMGTVGRCFCVTLLLRSFNKPHF